MANICENKVVVIGSPDAVRSFVEAAAGTVNAYDGNDHPTERSIIAAVRAGTPIKEAFRDANNRIDALRGTSARTVYDDMFEPRVAIPPVSADRFEEWAAGYEGKRDRGPEAGMHSHLSLESLRPMPPEIRGESHHLVGYFWCLNNWGCKFEPTVDAPEIKEMPDGRLMATYPTFDTPNGPALAAFEFASGNHPDVAIISAWSEEATDDFGYVVARRGENVVSQQLSADDLDPDVFEEDDGFRWVNTSSLWENLVYAAVTALDDEVEHEPRP